MPVITKVTKAGKPISAGKEVAVAEPIKNVDTTPAPITRMYTWVCKSNRANGKQCGKRIKIGVRCTDVLCQACNRPMQCTSEDGVLAL